MRNYTKPIVVINEEMAEGVYTASGDCYSVQAFIHQKPETGRGDYRVQVNGVHDAGNGHHSGEQILTISFNLPVNYKGSNGYLIGGSGSNTISIKYNYHNNAQDNIGLGDVIVESDEGLAVAGCTLSCNYDCGQH